MGKIANQVINSSVANTINNRIAQNRMDVSEAVYENQRMNNDIRQVANASYSMLGTMINSHNQNVLNDDAEEISRELKEKLNEDMFVWEIDESGNRVRTDNLVGSVEDIMGNMTARIEDHYKNDKSMLRSKKVKNAKKIAQAMLDKNGDTLTATLMKAENDNFAKVASNELSKVGSTDAFKRYDDMMVSLQVQIDAGDVKLTDGSQKILDELKEIDAKRQSGELTAEDTARFSMLFSKFMASKSSTAMGDVQKDMNFSSLDYDARLATSYAINSSMYAEDGGLYGDVLIGDMSRTEWVGSVMEGIVKDGIIGMDGEKITVTEGDANYLDIKSQLDEQSKTYEESWTKAQKEALETAKGYALSVSANGDDFFMYSSEEEYADYMYLCSILATNGHPTLTKEYALKNIPEDARTEIAVREKKMGWISDALQYQAIKSQSLSSYAEGRAKDEGRTEYDANDYSDDFLMHINMQTSAFLNAIMADPAEYEWFKESIGIGSATTIEDDAYIHFNSYELATSLFSDPFNKGNKYTNLMEKKLKEANEITDYQKESWTLWRSQNFKDNYSVGDFADFLSSNRNIDPNSKFARDTMRTLLEDEIKRIQTENKEANKKAEELAEDNGYISFLTNYMNYTKTGIVDSLEKLQSIEGYDLGNKQVRTFAENWLKSTANDNEENLKKLNDMYKETVADTYFAVNFTDQEFILPNDIIDFLDSKEAKEAGITMQDKFINDKYNDALEKWRSKNYELNEVKELDAFIDNIIALTESGHVFNNTEDYKNVEGYNDENDAIASYVSALGKGLVSTAKSSRERQNETEAGDMIRGMSAGGSSIRDIESAIMTKYPDTFPTNADAREAIRKADPQAYDKWIKEDTVAELTEYIAKTKNGDDTPISSNPYTATEEIVKYLDDEVGSYWMNVNNLELSRLVESWYGDKNNGKVDGYVSQIVLGAQYQAYATQYQAGYILSNYTSESGLNPEVAYTLVNEMSVNELSAMLKKMDYPNTNLMTTAELYTAISDTFFGGDAIVVNGKTLTEQDLYDKTIVDSVGDEYQIAKDSNYIATNILMPVFSDMCRDAYEAFASANNDKKIDDSMTVREQIKKDVSDISAITSLKSLQSLADSGQIHLLEGTEDIPASAWTATQSQSIIEKISADNLNDFLLKMSQVEIGRKWDALSMYLGKGGEFYGKLTESDYQKAKGYGQKEYNNIVSMYGYNLDVDKMISDKFVSTILPNQSQAYGEYFAEQFKLKMYESGMFEHELVDLLEKSKNNVGDLTLGVQKLVDKYYGQFVNSRISLIGEDSTVAKEVQKFTTKTSDGKTTYNYTNSQFDAIVKDINDGGEWSSVGFSDMGLMAYFARLSGVNAMRERGESEAGILLHYDMLYTSSKTDSSVTLDTDHLLTLGMVIAYEEMTNQYMELGTDFALMSNKELDALQKDIGKQITISFGGNNANDVLGELVRYGVALTNSSRGLDDLKNSAVFRNISDGTEFIDPHGNGYIHDGKLYTMGKNPITGKDSPCVYLDYNIATGEKSKMVVLDGLSLDGDDLDDNLDEINFGSKTFSLGDEEAINRLSYIQDRNKRCVEVYGNDADVYMPVFLSKWTSPSCTITKMTYSEAVQYAKQFQTTAYYWTDTTTKGKAQIDMWSLIPSL